MAKIKDLGYAYLIVYKEEPPPEYSDEDKEDWQQEDLLIQTSWDYPGVASFMGWTPCDKCRETDGTVDCEHKTSLEMIVEAQDWIDDHLGEEFDTLNVYFE